ncbi:hypothetical protein D3C75_1325590 [compost metagenome]
MPTKCMAQMLAPMIAPARTRLRRPFRLAAIRKARLEPTTASKKETTVSVGS